MNCPTRNVIPQPRNWIDGMSTRPACWTQKLNLTPMGFVVASLALSTSVQASPLHIVDGVFGPAEWTVSATDGSAARPTVSTSAFTVGGVSNAARLYAEQSNDGVPASGSLGSKLELLYDCMICVAPLPANAALDILFNSGPDDYVVHVFSALGVPAFQAFEKPFGTRSPLNPDGSLDLSSAVWTRLNAADLRLAKFAVAVGFGSSPNSSGDHYFAEFNLSVNTASSGSPANGLYSPDPAFWSASTSGSGGFRTGPISSGNFTLNPDGTTTVIPVTGPGGGPVTQRIPEPAALGLLLVGLGIMGVTAPRRQGRVVRRRT